MTTDQKQAVNDDVTLALSGGGIRSATFGLGVLQALAKSEVLGKVTTISTVSGGGFIGVFFCKLRKALGPKGAITLLSASDSSTRQFTCKGQPYFHPIAWLRENGRYLAPAGSGDTWLGIVYYLRGLIALHFVIAMLLLLAGFAAAGLDALINNSILPGSSRLPTAWVEPTVPPCLNCPSTGEGWVWLPSRLFIASGLAVLAVLALGMSYWISAPGRRLSFSTERFAGMVAMAIGGVAFYKYNYGQIAVEPVFVVTSLLLGVIGFFALLIVYLCKSSNLAELRTRLTRWTRVAFLWLLVLTVLALLDTVAKSVVRYHLFEGKWLPVLIPASAYLALLPLAWKSLAEKTSAVGNFLGNKLPLLAAAFSVVILMSLIVLYDVCAREIWLAANRNYVITGLPTSGSIVLMVGVATMAVFLYFTPEFLNLSSFHSLYRSRLRRAYMGAANLQRLEKLLKEPRSATVDKVFLGDDNDSHAQYAEENKQAEIEHIIGITINDSSAVTTTTAQLDIKGQPMYLTRDGVVVGRGRSLVEHSYQNFSKTNALKDTTSQWIAISAAAFSTGLGRSGATGYSMALLLANSRTGYWWPSPRPPSIADSMFGRLWQEISGQFKGVGSGCWHLSDGGHFENMALYEPVRRVLLKEPKEPAHRVMICTDCGADPKYQFENLANLTRRLRIDMGVELIMRSSAVFKTINSSVTRDLQDCFGTPDEFAHAHAATLKSGVVKSPVVAMWGEIYTDPGSGTSLSHKPDAVILIIKPMRCRAMAQDIIHYTTENSDFPQQPTGDQFFDEAQWESYRWLGEHQATMLFGSRQLLPAAYERTKG
jgi:hypothetical protein